MTYSIKVRRRWFWKTYKKLIGHGIDKDQNKMQLFFSNGSIMEIKDWDKCEIFLGTDWVIWTKNQMERETGQNIKLNVDLDS